MENEKALKSFMITLLVWNIASLAFVYFLSRWILEEVLKINFEIIPHLLSSLAAVSLVSLRSIFLIKLRLAKQAWLFFVFSVIGRVGVLLVSLLFVIYYEPTAHGRLLGAVLAEILCTALIYFYVFRNGGFKWPSLNYREIWTFTWPLILSAIVYHPIIALDQIILEKYATTTELGLYSIGLGFATYLHTFNFSVYQTLEPDIIRAHTEGNYAVLRSTTVALLLIAVFTTAIFCFTSRYLIDFMSHGKFTAAYELANWLSISFLFVLLFSIGSTLLTTSHRSTGVLLVNTVGLVCIVAFALILKRYESTGIAWARILTYGVIAVLSVFILRNRSNHKTVQIPEKFT